MPRTIEIAYTAASSRADIGVIRDESTLLTVTGTPPSEMTFEVSETAGGDAVVSVPDVAGSFELSQTTLVVLQEGKTYFYNIWDVSDPADPTRISFGSFAVQPSIAPSGVTYPTQFLEGIDAIVVLTQLEYDALTVKPANTLYIIRG